MTEAETFHWAISKILAAKTEQIFGTVTVQFENGRITIVKTEKTEKPPKA